MSSVAATATVKSGASLLIECLQAQGVDIIFGYPGGAIMPVYDALVGTTMRHILVRHEQGAALAADGYARITGKPGVCLATSGPGATNLVTGIANAYMDSVPMIAITGQVPLALMGTTAFQEVDTLGITLPIVKHSFLVQRASDIPAIVAEAFKIAQEGRPGPVLIDIPKDVAAGPVDALAKPAYQAPKLAKPDAEKIAQACALISAAQRPIFYIGGGMVISQSWDALRVTANSTGIPVISTLKALGSMPSDDENFLGMMGMHGNQAANHAVQEADLLIVCGARFDDRATGRLPEFAPHAKIIHIDTDASELSRLRYANVGLVGDLRQVLPSFNHLRVNPDWKAHCSANRKKYQWQYDAPGDLVYAPALLARLYDLAPKNHVVSCDVGQHQMWVAQHCRFDDPRCHLTSGGLGTMGYGLPAAIGAKFAAPERAVFVVSGDGSIMMNIQEMATLNRYKLPVKIILLDNSCLGMVRQWQQLFYEKRFSEVDLSDNPDFCVLAKAFGLEAMAIEKRDQVDTGLQWLIDCQGPALLHVKIDPAANVWPLVPPGKSNSVMMEEA